jgi:hypothetical protein
MSKQWINIKTKTLEFFLGHPVWWILNKCFAEMVSGLKWLEELPNGVIVWRIFQFFYRAFHKQLNNSQLLKEDPVPRTTRSLSLLYQQVAMDNFIALN